MRSFDRFIDGYWDAENQLAEHIKRRALELAVHEAAERRQSQPLPDLQRGERESNRRF